MSFLINYDMLSGLQRPSYVLAYGYAFTDALLKGLDEKQVKTRLTAILSGNHHC